jgi:hypothetical protein
VYRIDEGQPTGIGGCAATFPVEPRVVMLQTGQALDVHTVTDEPEGTAAPVPIYTLSTGPDISTLRLVATDGGGATAQYLAVAPGTVLVEASGPCQPNPLQLVGTCPLLKVTIAPKI